MIKGRRSVREFRDESMSREIIEKILEAGQWAPSGLNNQPWKFKVIENDSVKKQLAECSHYGRIIIDAPVSIAVFLDESVGYDRTKDVQAIGACIQNMLLEAHSLGLGAVWLGEILNKKDNAHKVLGTPEDLDLMAVISVGYPIEKRRTSTRKKLDEALME